MSDAKNGRIERRKFLVQTSLGALAGSVALMAGLPSQNLLRVAMADAKPEPLPAGAVAVPTSDPVATAIGYKPSIKEIEYTRFPNRKRPDAKNQFCKTCALYAPVNGSWGKCQMITTGLVASAGWCGSWSKKS